MGLGNTQGMGRMNALVEALRSTPMGNITRDIRTRVKDVLAAPLKPPRPPMPSRHKVDVLV